MRKLLLLLLLAHCLTAFPAMAQTPGLVRWASGSNTLTDTNYPLNNIVPAYNYTFRLPEATQAGNAVALCVVSDDSSNTATVSDDAPGGSNTWTDVVTGTDSANHMKAHLWLATNVKAGTRTIVPKFTTTYPRRVAVTGAEFYNVAASSAVDASSASSGSSTTMSAGSMTPTQSGDLIYQCGQRSEQYTTQAPSTLNVASPYVAGAQPAQNINWSLLSTDNWDGLVSQWGVQTTATAINPQLTAANTGGYVTAAVALKASPITQGSPRPPGMQIVGIQHMDFPNITGVSNITPKRIQFPTIGNLFVASIGPGGDLSQHVTSMSDSAGNTWASTGPVLGDANAGKSERYYAQNATPANHLTITTNWGTGYDSTVVLYDVVGAAASSFAAHQSHYDGGNMGGGSQYTTYTNVSPGTTSGIAFAQMSVAFNTVCGEDRNNPPTFLNNNMISPANALCDSYSYGGENLNGPMPLDENNGWAHYTFSTNANQTWTWPFAANSLISAYASTLDFFQAGANDVSAPTGLNVTVH